MTAGADINGHSKVSYKSVTLQVCMPSGFLQAAHRPLTVASAAGDTAIFHTLIKNGASIDIQDRVSLLYL